MPALGQYSTMPNDSPSPSEPERFVVEMFLVAVEDAIEEDEARRHWNVKETPHLDAALARSPSLYIGTTEVELPGNHDLRGPVGRVFDLLFLRGTLPAWVLPRIDDALSQDLLAAYEPQPHDPPFETVPPDELRAFLVSNRGAQLVPTSHPIGR
jgi:hypothetical protein